MRELEFLWVLVVLALSSHTLLAWVMRVGFALGSLLRKGHFDNYAKLHRDKWTRSLG